MVGLTFTILQNYGVQSCLVESKEPLATLLNASPDWQRIYTDGLSALFVRVGPDRETFAGIQAGSKSEDWHRPPFN